MSIPNYANLLIWNEQRDGPDALIKLSRFNSNDLVELKRDFNLSGLRLNTGFVGTAALDLGWPFSDRQGGVYDGLPWSRVVGDQQILPERTETISGLRGQVSTERRTFYFPDGRIDRKESTTFETSLSSKGFLVDTLTDTIDRQLYDEAIPTQQEITERQWLADRVEGASVIQRSEDFLVVDETDTIDQEGFNAATAQPSNSLPSERQISVYLTADQSVEELGEIPREDPIDSQFITSEEQALAVGNIALERAANQSTEATFSGLHPVAALLYKGRTIRTVVGPEERYYSVEAISYNQTGLSLGLVRIA